MKRKYSLKRRDLFREIFKRGKKFRTTGLRLTVLKCKEIRSEQKNVHYNLYPGIKIGISVNRRYGNAVTRNGAKRRIREICRELLSEMEVGYLMLFTPYAEFKEQNYGISKKNILNVLKMAGIVRDEG